METKRTTSAFPAPAAQLDAGGRGAAFPFEPDGVPDGFRLGDVVDMCVVAPGSGPVHLACLHVGPGMVSVSVVADGAGVLAATVPRGSFEPYAAVPMSPASGSMSVSGFVSFGEVDFGSPYTFRGSVPVSESAVIRPAVGRLMRFVQDARDKELSGDVELDLRGGLSVEVSSSGGTSTILFRADESAVEAVDRGCGSGDLRNASPVPVKSINGVKPDGSGRIAIVFSH